MNKMENCVLQINSHENVLKQIIRIIQLNKKEVKTFKSSMCWLLSPKNSLLDHYHILQEIKPHEVNPFFPASYELLRVLQFTKI